MKTIDQNRLVNSVKTFINLLPINWTSSIEQPISKLYSESGLNKANGPIIYNILCNMGLSEKEGNVRGMRYRAGNIKNIDAQNLAEKVVETYYEFLKEKKFIVKKLNLKKNDKITPKYYTIGQTVYFINDNKLQKGIIIGVNCNIEDDVIIDIVYTIFIKESKEAVNTEKVFENIDLLKQYLDYQYKAL